MPLIPDEEDFDSRLPPWVYQDGAVVELPEAQLSEDAGPTQADPQELEMSVPQPWRPEERKQRQDEQAEPEQQPVRNEPQPSRRQVRKEASRETHRDRREEVEQGRQFQKDAAKEERRIRGDVAQQWRPPIFDNFQAVNAMAGSEDEVNLGDPMTIARADPTVDMQETVGLAEVAYQNAEVAAEQSRYIHNATSRLRDTEVGFMVKNYV